MRADFRDELASALRGGRFKQVKGYLCGGEEEGRTLCCASGVAGVLLGGECLPVGTCGQLPYYVMKFPSEPVAYSLRLPARVTSPVMTSSEERELVRQNDLGRTFEDIAAWVESLPPTVQDEG